ncbi:cytochrome P450 [Gautieria morchelliformis]|nr:cytochrome P450 [Gautieria morchelliformis]
MFLYTFVVKWAIQCICTLTVTLVTFIVLHEVMRPRNLPPTPGNRPPLPFIGHKLDIPKEKSWIVFRKWNEQYGPILTVWNGSSPMILVGDPEIAVELLEKRSAKYSSRPRFVVAGDLLTENRTILFASYGERWRSYRKALHLATMPKSVDTYLPVFDMEGKVLAADLIRKPDDWYHSIFRYAASSVVSIAYGRRIIDTRTDAAYRKLTTNNEFLTQINVPGAQWHETIPALRFLPASINRIKRLALHYRQSGRENFASLVDEVRAKLAAGRGKYADLDDQEFNQQPGSVFAAGVDTTSATLQSLILALVLHPDVQQKAHEEMDRIIGQTRSPSWDGEPKLPYLQAGLRWRPVAILGGTPHASTEDDMFAYKGKVYFIPKGSTILGNLWSIHMNPRTYESPDAYDAMYPGTGGKGHSSFGWGRRICPGAYFAERSLYITAARLIWGFMFLPATDASTGMDLKPDASMETGYTSGFNCRPHPFPCNIVPRSHRVREVCVGEEKEALEVLRMYEDNYD